MPVVLPPTIENGDLEDADVVMAHINALASKFTEGDGGIGDDDFTASTGRKLDGGKIATNSIPGPALRDEAVTEDKLQHADTDSSGDDAGRAVSGYHIKTLTAAHVDRIIPDAVLALDKLKVTLATAPINLSPITGGIAATAVLTLSATFPKATYDCLGFYIKNGAGTAAASTTATLFANDTGTNWTASINAYSPGTGTFTGTAVYIFIAKSTT